MRNFSSKRRENFHHSSKGVVLKILGAITIAVLLLFLLRGLLGGALVDGVLPLYKVRAWFAESGSLMPSYLQDKSILLEKIESLTRENSTLKSEIGEQEVVSAENEELRKLLGDEGGTPRIVAGVIARPPFLPYDALLIDRGSNAGVKEDAVVYHYGNQVVGVVSGVQRESAFVTLLSTPGTSMTVYVIGPNIYTTAYGEGDGVLRVSVPQGILLQEGDTVVLPTLERGILGTIAAVRSEPTEPEQSGYIISDTPIQSLKLVAVEASPLAPVSFEEAREHLEIQKAALFTVDVPDDILIDEATTTPSTPDVSEETSTSTEEVSNSEAL